MSRIRIAEQDEFLQVRDFYWQLIDDMHSSLFRPGWEKGIYPADDFLRKSLKNHELFVMIQNDHIVSSMVLNHECNEGYKQAKWNVEAQDDEITMIHALGVLPQYQEKGYAKTMVQEAIRVSKERKQKAIRLDVLSGNAPACRLYERIGFQYRSTVSMYYEDTDWTDFLLYELKL